MPRGKVSTCPTFVHKVVGANIRIRIRRRIIQIPIEGAGIQPIIPIAAEMSDMCTCIEVLTYEKSKE